MGKLTINGNFSITRILNFWLLQLSVLHPTIPREIPRVSHTSLKRWPGRYAPDEPEKNSASWGRGSQLSELGIQQWTRNMTLFNVYIYLFIYLFLIYIYICNYSKLLTVLGKKESHSLGYLFQKPKKPSITITNCDTKFHVYPHEAFGQWRRVFGGFSIPLSQYMVEDSTLSDLLQFSIETMAHGP